MKKLLLLSIVMLCLLSIAVSQSNMIDVVKLKNGNTLKGVIIEQIPNEYVKLKTPDGNVWTLDPTDIEKITREEQKNTAQSSYVKGNKSDQSNGGDKKSCVRSGRLQLLEVSQDIMFGKGYGDSPLEMGNFYFTRIDYIRGRQIGQYFSVGFNTGLNLGYGELISDDIIQNASGRDIYVEDEFITFSVPALVDLRVYVLKGPIVPYIGLNGGLEIMYYYSDKYDDYFAPLITFTPRVGCNFTIGKGMGVNVFVGYKGMYSLRSSVEPLAERYYNGINFGLGFRF